MNLDTVIGLVRRTAPLLLDDASAAEVTRKGSQDYVTAVDLAVQDFLQRELALLDPSVGFMAEEGEAAAGGGAEQTWILDPVDGTTNLMHGCRHSAVSLALLEGGHVTLGVVYNPFSGELFDAARGGGARLNGRPIRVTGTDTLRDCLVAFGTSPYDRALASKDFELARDVFLECRDIRRTGSAALDLAYVACGRLDVFFERNLKPWDIAAGALLVEEAGGRAGGWRGGAFGYRSRSDVLATNGKMHGEMLRRLSGC